MGTGEHEGQQQSPEGKPEAGGLILAIPPPLVSLRTLKSLSFSTYKVKIWEDSALPKVLFLLSYSKVLWFQASSQQPFIEYLLCARHWALCSRPWALKPGCLVQIMALPLPSWVTSGKSLNHSVPQFPHLKNGDNNGSTT